MAVNLTKNQEEITKAWRKVVDSKTTQEWALYGYEGNTNNIKLISSGSDGLKGLVQEFNCSLIQYAFCRVIDAQLGINKLVLINWQGDSSPLSRKGLCASHVGDVANYFKGCTQTITIRNDDESTQEYLMDQIIKSSSSRISLSSKAQQHEQQQEAGKDSNEVGSSYKKTDIRSEISMDRKTFWQRQEEEEKERLLEEKKRAIEKQAQFEKERKVKEELEAKKLAETIKERDRIIEATRQADRQQSSGSQPSSIVSTNQDNDDDDRVGRRSELIRLERNQETQSLISKGLIKNKRAIFEQASQQQQNQPPSGNNLTRRSSGAMVAQRLNSFKSIDGSTSGGPNVEKLTNGFAKHVKVDEGAGTVKREVESIKITNDAPESDFVSSQTSAVPSPKKEKVNNDVAPTVEGTTTTNHQTTQSPIKANGAALKAPASSENNNYKPNISPKQEPKQPPVNEEVVINGKYGIRAKAMYDYEASDGTEISFDPDDIIGFIDKVDVGWWHGSVITGKYKGQSGLFPANYVEEI